MKKLLIMLLLVLLVNNLSAQDTCGTSIVTYAGKTYNTVLIGDQCWFKENLDVGTAISQGNGQWNNGILEKYCYDCDLYGGLYQWYEAMNYATEEGAQGICPTGWHIPTSSEFQTLASEVGNSGNALKSVGQGYGGGEGTNTSGFSMMLAGYRSTNALDFNYNYLAYSTVWGALWSSSSPSGSIQSTTMSVWDNQNTIYSDNENKTLGLSVRCLAIIPTTVTLSSPANNATDQLKQASLSWSSVSDATNYQVQIASDINFSNVVSDQVVSTNSATAAGLAFTSSYYWRVRSISVAGLAGNWSSISQFATTSTLVVGDSHQGGKILYVDASGESGLIAAPSDQSSGIQWYNGSFTTTSATGDSVGAGMLNTNLIVANQGVGSYAAYLCDTLTVSNYNDWYLPSKIELNLMYQHKSSIGGFGSGYYWSSNEGSNNNLATRQGFSDGFVIEATKNIQESVRAIRTFSVYETLPTTAVTLSSPSNNATNQGIITALAWESVSNATSYQVQVSTVSDFRSSIVYDQNPSTNTAIVTGLQVSTTYYWRARAINSVGLGDWSSIFQFTTTSYTNHALAFDGTNDYVQIPHNSLLVPANITIEFWAKSNTATWNNHGMLVSKRNNYIIHPTQGSKELIFYVDINGTGFQSVSFTPTFDITKYHHYACTYDGSTIRIYLDGNEVASSAVSGSIGGGGTGNLYLGGDIDADPTRVFDGKMDEVRIWNTARTASEISANMNNSSLSPSTTGLVAYYNFDHGNSGGTNTGLTSLIDATSNGLNGTLTNFALSGSNSNWVNSLVDFGTAPIVTLSSPSNNATDLDHNAVVLSWESFSSVTSYRVQVSTVSDFSSNVVYDQTPSTISVNPTGLTYSTTYYWRVKATNLTGTGDYSSVNQFTTAAYNNRALAFAASNSNQVHIPHSNALVPANITVELWAKSETSNWEGAFIYKKDAYYITTVYNTKELKVYIYLTGSGYTSLSFTPTIDITGWHHYAFNYDGTTLRFYIDGIEVASKAISGSINGADTGDLILGYDENWGYFQGQMDEVRIWNTARTASEIYTNMNNTNMSASTSGLVAYYHFDQGTAGGNNSGLITLIDASSNGLNGSLWFFALNYNTSNWIASGVGSVPAVLLSSPANNATSQAITVGLSWGSIANATSYQVQIASDVNFSNIVSDQTPTTNSANATGLAYSTTYYWRVRATTSLGTGNYSSVYQFTTSAYINNALSFDGFNDYVDATSNASLDFSTGITMEGWIKTTSTSEQYIMDKDGSYWLSVSTPGAVGKAGIWLAGVSSDWTLSIRKVNDGNWHHVAATWDNTTNTISIYIDGTLDVSTSKGGTITASGSPVEIGRRSTYGYFNGTMDELRIWNIARTESEIASNKNNVNLSPTSNGLIAYYHFDQGTAGGDNTGVTSLTDATSGLNGALTNFALSGSSSNWVTANTGTIATSGVGTTFLVFSNANFALRAENGTVDANFEFVSSSPQNTTGGARTLSHYWDITNLTGATKIRLYYTASERSSFTGTPTIYHYTGSAWVALPTEAEGTEGPFKYVETTNYYSSFSPVTVGDSNAPLPVELTSFSASLIESSIELNWQTATEVNNYGFDIQRSVASSQLSEKEWKAVGFIEGHGNSNSPNSYQFVDNISGSGNYLYRLKQIDTDGKFKYTDEIEVEFEALPTKYELAQNYPNPFNPSTVINFQLPKNGFTSLKVYDILGREVATLINEEKIAGKYSAKFDASNLTSGIYFSRLTSGNYSSIKKMLLIK